MSRALVHPIQWQTALDSVEGLSRQTPESPAIDQVRADFLETKFGMGAWVAFKGASRATLYAIINPDGQWYVWMNQWTSVLANAKTWMDIGQARTQSTKIAKLKGVDYPTLVQFRLQFGEPINEQERIERVLKNQERLTEKHDLLRREAARAREMEREAQENARRRRGVR